MENMVDDKVFVRGVWVQLTSEELNKMIGAPDYVEDAYSEMIEKGIDPDVLTSKLYKPDEKIGWTTGKNNQPLSFATSTLLPQLVPLLKFICCRLIPTTHTSHVTIDRATLLLAMIEKREIDAGWIIYNNIIDSLGAGKGLWFPAIITKLCVSAGVKIEKGEEKVKAGLQILAKASTDPVGTPRAAGQISEELHHINNSLKQLTKFSAQQQAWNKFMEHARKETISSLNLPSFHAGPSAPPTKKTPTDKGKAKAKEPAPTPREPTEEEDEEEEIASHLGRGEPLIGHFISTNLSSDDDEEN